MVMTMSDTYEAIRDCYVVSNLEGELRPRAAGGRRRQVRVRWHRHPRRTRRGDPCLPPSGRRHGLRLRLQRQEGGHQGRGRLTLSTLTRTELAVSEFREGDLVRTRNQNQNSPTYADWRGRLGIIVHVDDEPLDTYTLEVLWAPTGDMSRWDPIELVLIARTT